MRIFAWFGAAAALCCSAPIAASPRISPIVPLSPVSRFAALVKQLPDSPDKNTPRIVQLRAGPIRVKFQDGELRYLRVGDKEIARRIYFGVRDGDWNTAMPKFTRIEVHKQPRSFAIALEADCRSAAADYHWEGRIVGKPNGEIRFTAKGSPNADFKSNRIGLCLLYGVQSLAGQRFATISASGARKAGAFPHLVSPTLVAEKFQSLRYTTASGLTVTSTLKGARFDMEDQRNWGDTSYKAYAPLPYQYPNVSKGDAKRQEITLSVTGSIAAAPVEDETVTHVTIGKLMPVSFVPTLGFGASNTPEHPFADINMKRPAKRSALVPFWGLNPCVHLPDDDVAIENLPTIVDQAATVRTFANSRIPLVAPIRIRRGPADGSRDPRNGSAFGGAWCAAVIKYLALAGVETAEFDMGPGAGQASIDMFSRFETCPLYDTTIRGTGRFRVEAWAVETDPDLFQLSIKYRESRMPALAAWPMKNSKPVLFLINMTPHAQRVVCDHVPRVAVARLTDGALNPTPPTREVRVTGGRISVELGPYEICVARFKN